MSDLFGVLLLIFGLAAVVAGFAMISPAAGWIAVGCVAVATGQAILRSE